MRFFTIFLLIAMALAQGETESSTLLYFTLYFRARNQDTKRAGTTTLYAEKSFVQRLSF